MYVASLYEIAELPSGDPRSRHWILVDLGNSCSGRCVGMGTRRRGFSLAEGEVDRRNLGVGDPVAWAGKLCVAGDVDDSTQGSVRVASRGRDGKHPLRSRARSVLFSILDFIFLRAVQPSLANGAAIVRG